MRSAGFTGDLDDLVEQWDAMVEYAINTLNLSRTSHSKVRSKLFNFSISCCRMVFSLTGRVKPTVRASLGEKRLNTIIRICHENPALENFDAKKAVQISYVDKLR